MRHRRGVEPGTMDFLFIEIIEWARTQGHTTFNLGLSALSGVGEHPEDPVVERVMHYIYEHINLFYNFKGLHAFKQKYHPEWSPRYLIYESTLALPSVWWGIIQANSGAQNFPYGFLLRGI
jgi:phosphatidylglycerol lysyltransferase